MCVRMSWFVFLLIFYLDVLSIIETKVLESSVIIVELSISFFSSVSLSFMYFSALLLGA